MTIPWRQTEMSYKNPSASFVTFGFFLVWMRLQRVQDWNVSRKELQELVHAGVLTQTEIEEVISIEFNPVSAIPLTACMLLLPFNCHCFFVHYA